MSDGKAEASSRGAMLRHLREVHAVSVERAQALFREQRRMQQAICQFVRDNPRTVPEIAAHLGKPSHEVLWFVAALRKYGIVVETGMCGDYPLYKRVDEAQP
jgi:predicted transcriptional regulator